MRRKQFSYRLCGWHTISEIPLTGIPETPLSLGEPDVQIEFGTGTSPIAHVTDWFDTDDCTLIKVRDVADFEVSYGRKICVWPYPQTTNKDIETFLFGTVWGCLCHQRGVVPLHASAVLDGDSIVAFAGHSGSGKSTTAAMMASFGYPLLADDILPASFCQGSIPGAWPYLRRLKLRENVIKKIGFKKIAPIGSKFDERYYASADRIAGGKWYKIRRLYIIEIDPRIASVTIDKLSGKEALSACINHTYRFDFISDSGKFREYFRDCSLLSSKAEVYRVGRPWVIAPEDFSSAISTHLAGHPHLEAIETHRSY